MTNSDIVQAGQVWHKTRDPTPRLDVLETLPLQARIRRHGEDATYWVLKERFVGPSPAYEPALPSGHASRALRAMIAVLVVAHGISCGHSIPHAQERSTPTAYVVIDGDTIRSPAGVTYRLLGFDTPETFRARCDAELTLGLRAKQRLEALIASGTARIIESGRLDRYRRSLATLTVNGRDIAEILIGEGLARAYAGRRRE